MKGLKDKEIKKIKEELDNSTRPIFLFHDDADGLCSFLLLYRYIKEGIGVVVKSRPSVDEKFIRKVVDYEADKVFVLDLALMKQEFVNGVKRPVIWIDHHKPNELNKVTYFNPRVHKSDIIYPATNICYDVVKQDLWIAMAGCVGDWYLPEFKDEFCEKYPDLLDKNIKSPPEALFDSKLGKLVKIINFILKGDTRKVKNSVKVMTRIKSPYEILNQETAQGKYLYKIYEKINEPYEAMLKEAKKKVGKEKLVVYTYQDDRMSFTGEVSNELLYRNPDKVIIIAREKNGEMRMSLRSSDVILPPILDKVLAGLEGYGGGHEHACGACVKKEDFKQFINDLKNEIKES
jgi:single-stranded DNA-specific DHH superfamily exonuclease